MLKNLICISKYMCNQGSPYSRVRMRCVGFPRGISPPSVCDPGSDTIKATYCSWSQASISHMCGMCVSHAPAVPHMCWHNAISFRFMRP